MIEIAEPLIRERFFAEEETEERMCRRRCMGVRGRRVDWEAMWREAGG